MEGIQPIVHDVAAHGGSHHRIQLASGTRIPGLCATHIAQGQSMTRIPTRFCLFCSLRNALSVKHLEMDELTQLITLPFHTLLMTHFSPLVVANIEEGVLSNDHGELHLRELLAKPPHKINAAKLVISGLT